LLNEIEDDVKEEVKQPQAPTQKPKTIKIKKDEIHEKTTVAPPSQGSVFN